LLLDCKIATIGEYDFYLNYADSENIYRICRDNRVECYFKRYLFAIAYYWILRVYRKDVAMGMRHHVNDIR